MELAQQQGEAIDDSFYFLLARAHFAALSGRSEILEERWTSMWPSIGATYLVRNPLRRVLLAARIATIEARAGMQTEALKSIDFALYDLKWELYFEPHDRGLYEIANALANAGEMGRALQFAP